MKTEEPAETWPYSSLWQARRRLFAAFLHASSHGALRRSILLPSNFSALGALDLPLGTRWSFMIASLSPR